MEVLYAGDKIENPGTCSRAFPLPPLGSMLEAVARRRCVVATRTSFTGEVAPCGKVMAGVRYTDRDDDGMVVEHLHYACGCQDFRDAFHDGSVHTRVVHHNGRVLVDEELRGE
jgi:hypothetical protein